MIVAVCLEDMVLCTAEEGRRERGRLGRGGGSEGGKRGGGGGGGGRCLEMWFSVEIKT